MAQPSEHDGGQKPVHDAIEQTRAELAAAGLGQLHTGGARFDSAYLQRLYNLERELAASEGYYGAQPRTADINEVAKLSHNQQSSTKILMVHDKNPERPQTYLILSRNDPSMPSAFLRFQLESTAVSPKM